MAGPTKVRRKTTTSNHLGKAAGHNVVIAVLPDGVYGTTSAASVARDMLRSFTNVRIGLMVGIGGGAPSPSNNIHLGDIVVSIPKGNVGGVFQYDFGKTIQDKSFQYTGHLDKPPSLLLSAVASLSARFKFDGNPIAKSVEAALGKRGHLRDEFGLPNLASDRLYDSNFIHPNGQYNCTTVCDSEPQNVVDRKNSAGWAKRNDEPMVFRGVIASANALMKDALIRDTLSQENGVLCFEMEAAGLMNNFPCLVVRGICDYSDTHKNDAWQGYAAMCAAAYVKELLGVISPRAVEAQEKLFNNLYIIKKNLSLVENITSATQSTVKAMETNLEHSQLKDWLRPGDPSNNHVNAQQQHFAGSGDWLKKDSRFINWISQHHSVLWLYGLPGCGKTILSSTIIDSLSKSHICLYFYFTFQEEENLSLDKMLRSLIWQLCSRNKASQPVLNQLHALCAEDPPRDPRSPSTKELSTAFSDMLRLGQEVWIVIDALDEYITTKDSNDANRLFNWISDIVVSRHGNVHLLVTSREQDEIHSAFRDLPGIKSIPIEGPGLKRDIENFVTEKIAYGNELKRWRGLPKHQDFIRIKLLEKAKGMFRYVACEIKELGACLDPFALRNALRNIPKDINGIYSRIMRQVPESYKANTIRILQFLIYSGRPLRIEELIDVIAIQTDNSIAFDPDDRMPEPTEIARYCSSLTKLVQITSKDGVRRLELHLAHFSVQEYLVSTPEYAQYFDPMTARASIAIVCMSYLRQMDYETGEGPGYKAKLETTFPFIRYSSRNWMRHAAATEKHNPTVFKKTMDFLLDFNANYYKNWSFYRQYHSRDNYHSPLWHACKAGLSTHCLEHLLKDERVKNLSVNHERHHGVEESFYYMPLDIASERGDLENMRFLMDKGEVPHGWHFRGPCKNGNEEAVKLLLQYGSLMDPWRDYGPEAFIRACQRGHLRIVELLIDHDPAFVDISTEYEGTPVLAACDAGQEEVALLLLQNGADLKGGSGSEIECKSVFEAAIKRGLKTMLKTMVGVYHAVPDCEDLEMAVRTGNEQIVQILWDSGKLNTDDLNSALLIAKEEGHDVIVSQLSRIKKSLQRSRRTRPKRGRPKK